MGVRLSPTVLFRNICGAACMCDGARCRSTGCVVVALEGWGRIHRHNRHLHARLG